MISENYINVVNQLNEILFKKCEFLYNHGIHFEYTTSNYMDYIMFGGICLFDSDNDTNINTEHDLRMFLGKELKSINQDIHTLII